MNLKNCISRMLPQFSILNWKSWISIMGNRFTHLWKFISMDHSTNNMSSVRSFLKNFRMPSKIFRSLILLKRHWDHSYLISKKVDSLLSLMRLLAWRKKEKDKTEIGPWWMNRSLTKIGRKDLILSRRVSQTKRNMMLLKQKSSRLGRKTLEDMTSSW